LFHRYKMPELYGKVESKGNGIKTVLVNVSEVAEALKRPVTYIVKYFGCTLGSQTEEKDGRYIVHGEHSNTKLLKQLDKFIDTYVLCKVCHKNPETKIIVKCEMVILDCKACGARSPVSTKDKLLVYILKNRPTSSSKGYTDPRDGAMAKLGSLTLDDEEDDSTTKSDEGVWLVDTSEDAVRRRRMALLGEAADPALQLKKLLEESGDGESLVQKVKSVQRHAGWNDAETIAQIVHQIFDPKNIVQQIPAKASLLSKFVASDAAQTDLLKALEVLCGVTHPDAGKDMAKILMAMYDAELLSEEAILSWHADTASKAVPQEVAVVLRNHAVPMITWLNTAEEDE